MTYEVAVGLDLSLTGAGVGVVQDLPDDPDLPRFAVHTFGRKGSDSEPLAVRRERITDLTRRILDEMSNLLESPWVAMIEQPAYGQTTGKTHDRSGLWWMVVEGVERRFAVPVVEVTPQKVKIYATGKGNADKDVVLASVVRRYPDAPISNNNEADAFVLAAMGMRLIGAPIEESLPQTHLRAMEGLALP